MKRIIKAILNRFNYDVHCSPPALIHSEKDRLKVDLGLLVPMLAARIPQAIFVIVGANDGAMGEELLPWAFRYDWRGVLIEPQEDMYQQLVQNTVPISDRVCCIRAAVDHEDGERILYRIKSDAEYPDWVKGIASFDRECLLKCKKWYKEIEKDIIESVVPCMTFDRALHQAGVSRYDILQIDTEGYDFEILKMARIDTVRPALIKYEYCHLSRTDWDKSVRYLIQHGYRIANDWRDVIALRPDLIG